jgi:hypothetical protein
LGGRAGEREGGKKEGGERADGEGHGLSGLWLALLIIVLKIAGFPRLLLE